MTRPLVQPQAKEPASLSTRRLSASVRWPRRTKGLGRRCGWYVTIQPALPIVAPSRMRHYRDELSEERTSIALGDDSPRRWLVRRRCGGSFFLE
jgi:hypothetical protein